jgi:ubiquinone/menaquinone biosynthesis C-methylase UbiE
LNVFDKMGIYWAEISDQNPTQRQVEFLKNTLKSQGPILDLACGTGRHITSLSKKYDVVGVDISPNLLKIAKNRLSRIQLVRADMRRLPFKSEAFATAISMDTSLGYLHSLKEDMQSLKELRETIKPNGLVIIDVFNREHLLQKHSAKNNASFRRTEYPSFFLSQQRTIDKNGAKLRDLWKVCDKTNGRTRIFRHVVRLYQLKDLQDLLEKAGFVIKQANGDYEGQQFSPDSNRLILVATTK